MQVIVNTRRPIYFGNYLGILISQLQQQVNQICSPQKLHVQYFSNCIHYGMCFVYTGKHLFYNILLMYYMYSWVGPLSGEPVTMVT